MEILYKQQRTMGSYYRYIIYYRNLLYYYKYNLCNLYKENKLDVEHDSMAFL